MHFHTIGAGCRRLNAAPVGQMLRSPAFFGQNSKATKNPADLSAGGVFGIACGLARQRGRAHQEGVDLAGGLAALADRPDDQRLTTTHVAGGIHLVDVGLVAAFAVSRCLGILARILLDTEGVKQATDRIGEAHRQEGGIAWQFEFRTGDFSHLAALPVQTDSLQCLDAALAVIDEALGGDGEFADGFPFLVRRRGAHLQRPVRPDQRLVFLGRRSWHQFELGHRGSTMAVAGADAVGTGIAAADDDDVLALDVDRVLDALLDFLVLRNQEFQRGVDALELTPRHRQIARHFGAGSEDHGVEILLQLLGRNGFGRIVVDAGRNALVADDDLGLEDHAFGFHLGNATVDHRLVQLEVGNAETKQAADPAGLLEHGDVMADARQLLGGSHAGRAGTDDGDLLAGLDCGRLRHDPAHFPALVDDEMLNRLDAHRRRVDAQRTGSLAGRRADATGEIREVVGGVQHFQGLLPVAAVNQIVPVRNDVVDRATVVAERNAAIHAARALRLGSVVRQGLDEFLVVRQALFDRFVGLFEALELHESSRLAHYAASFCAAAAISVSARLYSCG